MKQAAVKMRNQNDSVVQPKASHLYSCIKHAQYELASPFLTDKRVLDVSAIAPGESSSLASFHPNFVCSFQVEDHQPTLSNKPEWMPGINLQVVETLKSTFKAGSFDVMLADCSTLQNEWEQYIEALASIVSSEGILFLVIKSQNGLPILSLEEKRAGLFQNIQLFSFSHFEDRLTLVPGTESIRSEISRSNESGEKENPDSMYFLAVCSNREVRVPAGSTFKCKCDGTNRVLELEKELETTNARLVRLEKFYGNTEAQLLYYVRAQQAKTLAFLRSPLHLFLTLLGYIISVFSILPGVVRDYRNKVKNNPFLKD